MDIFGSLLNRPSISAWDLVDVLVVSVLIYEALKLIRGTRAIQMAIGSAMVIVLLYLSQAFPLRTVNWLIRNLLVYLPFAAIVLFQQDIRRALSNLGEAEPTPEALARLLGLPLEGSATFAGHECWLIGLLRDRIRALHGEFRTDDGDFALVTVSNHPGVAVRETGDVRCARALVLNAPRHALAGVVDQDPVPDLLATPAPSRRRLVVHLRMPRAQLPSGMARRVLVVRDPSLPPDGTNLIRVRAFAGEPRSGLVDLLASAVIAADEADVAAREHEIEAAVAELLPFARGELSRSEEPTPRWDRDDWLCDPPASRGWPAACDVRLGSRPATFAFDRAEIGALGFEGDLILGWRGGDVVAAELA